ncbi:caspase family protein [Candidatus Uabimicrobium amorphum]|uniref:Polysaccharide deacetylase n=1 Tax=Uabimicrobium amorphum TaxID=2596890 RepID=A0A5S9F5X8_UABAM|nr:caspase family protein [Candidatus Uabimicrobium amorphum]BBM86583.1 polysaccharide deacetylase [Candidatus Uabimicrobium amorphum]
MNQQNLTSEEIEQLALDFFTHRLADEAHEVLVAFKLKKWYKISLDSAQSWQKLLDHLMQENLLGPWLDKFTTYPFARKWLEKLCQTPVFYNRLQRPEINQNERVKVKTSPPPPKKDSALAYLCNRDSQTDTMHMLFEDWCENEDSKERPLFFVVHGPEEECCAQYLDVVEHRKLENIIQETAKTNVIVDRGKRPPLQWPDDDVESPELHLTRKVKKLCPPAGGQRKAVVLRLPVAARDWKKRGTEVVHNWLKKLNREKWPQLRHNLLCVFLCIEYNKLPSWVIALKKLWYTLTLRKMTPDQKYRPLKSLEEIKDLPYYGVFHSLPQLRPLRQSDVLKWIEEHKTEFSEEQLKQIKTKCHTFFEKHERIAMLDFVNIIKEVRGMEILRIPQSPTPKIVAAVFCSLLLGFVIATAVWPKPVAASQPMFLYRETATNQNLESFGTNISKWKGLSILDKYGTLVKVRRMGKTWHLKFHKVSSTSKKITKKIIFVEQPYENSLKIWEPISATYRALIIYITKYDGKDWSHLKTPENDALCLRHVLMQKYGFDEKNIRVLAGNNAEKKTVTTKDIKNALEKLYDDCGKDDSVVIFYAGHGGINNRKKGFWQAQDDEFGYATLKDLTDSIAEKAGHLLVVADCCYSGKLVTRSGKKGIEREKEHKSRYIVENMKRKSYQIFTSSNASQEAMDEYQDKGHSPFINFFLEALRNNQDCLDTSQLVVNIKKKVEGETGQQPLYIRANLPITGYENTGEFLFINEDSDADCTCNHHQK